MAAAETGGRPTQPPSVSADAAAAEDIKTQQKLARKPPSVYFPLGYKEAAYQWVCL